MGLIRTQEEMGRHIRMLTHEIRSTLDRHTILKTTLVKLGRTVALEVCVFWMPTHTGLELQLFYTLHHQNPMEFTVPIQLPVINQVISTNRVVKISPNCPVARLQPLAGKYMPGEVVVGTSISTEVALLQPLVLDRDIEIRKKSEEILVQTSTILEYDLRGEGDLFKALEQMGALEPIVEKPVIRLGPMTAAISIISCREDVISSQPLKVVDIESIQSEDLFSEFFYECKKDILAKDAIETPLSDVLDIKILVASANENLVAEHRLPLEGPF
ncbi:hypothetical protein F0562_007190 [Nyssa sinensis]|uniref:Uncharacterized protein n=1 Tax=Nyssa sinensis TaxID=561372 RepID=A0A5J5A6C9_9ASTE|nr:hypothetical protein F0562_007190 [Nyssa sinensis]